ncbi:hypothetical protein [Methanococcoides sp. LMO-2]|uniref:Uncharacterized protein n=1 Tax=Methanococcoides cohabitans TaxID=3136559 RepID=A0ABU9KV04_9EURY
MKIVKLAVAMVAMMALLAVMPAAMGHNYIDVKPGSCPNAVNLNSNGLLPIAILGSPQLDVTEIDPDTIEVGFNDTNGAGVMTYVPIVRYSYEDVSGPIEDPDPCCNRTGPDGLLDLTVKVSIKELVDAGLDVDDYPKLEVRFDMKDGPTDVRSLWDCLKMIDNSDKGGGPDSTPAQANNKKMK